MGETLVYVSQRLRHFQFMLAVLLWASLCLPAFAQEGASRGSVTLTYQYVREGKINTTIGRIDIGELYTHSLLLDVEFSLNDKWELFGSLPFIMKRYDGLRPHDPATLSVPVDEPFIDDGDYHSDFQDFTLGVRYSAGQISRFQVKPFVSYGVPTSDYPIYAHASVGQNLRKLDVGAVITFVPMLSDVYYSVAASRVFSEQAQGVNVDYWRLDGEIGYFLNPRLAVKGFFAARKGNGLKFPDDFPLPRNDEHWYEHERLLAIEYVVLAAGLDWSFNERDRLSLAVLKSVHADMIHEVDYGVSVGISHAF